MQHSIGHTLADESDGAAGASSKSSAPHLVVLLEGERPLALSSRHSLQGVSSLVLGRGSERRALRPAQRRRADLEVSLPDLRMSKNHAILTRVRGSWVIEDSSSRNGTRVNGRPVQQQPLQDGDLIEVGRSVLLFRADLQSTDALDLDADPEHGQEPLTLNPALQERFQQLQALAPNKDVSLLILGESGTGKEVLAQQIARWSNRPGEFVGVNCGAIAESLMESELFGSIKGAFSGASSDRLGLVRSAHRGCLFLDEIADLPKASQAALLRVLQEQEVLPVGATRPVPVDVRVLSATHQDLDAAVARGDFRQDLFARIAGFRCVLPPLRQRVEDLGLLIGRVLQRLTQRPPSISSEAIVAMARHDWPLNVRELHTALSAAATLAEDGTIQLKHLPQSVTESRRTTAVHISDLTPQQREHRRQLAELLEQHAGNVSAVARDLGKARVQIQRWLKRYDLDPTSYRS